MQQFFYGKDKIRILGIASDLMLRRRGKNMNVGISSIETFLSRISLFPRLLAIYCEYARAHVSNAGRKVADGRNERKRKTRRKAHTGRKVNGSKGLSNAQFQSRYQLSRVVVVVGYRVRRRSAVGLDMVVTPFPIEHFRNRGRSHGARIACAGVSSNFRPGPGCLKHFRFRDSIPPLPIKRPNYTEHEPTRFSTPRLQRSPHSSASASLYFNSTQFTEVCAESRAKNRK